MKEDPQFDDRSQFRASLMTVLFSSYTRVFSLDENQFNEASVLIIDDNTKKIYVKQDSKYIHVNDDNVLLYYKELETKAIELEMPDEFSDRLKIASASVSTSLSEDEQKLCRYLISHVLYKNHNILINDDKSDHFWYPLTNEEITCLKYNKLLKEATNIANINSVKKVCTFLNSYGIRCFEISDSVIGQLFVKCEAKLGEKFQSVSANFKLSRYANVPKSTKLPTAISSTYSTYNVELH